MDYLRGINAGVTIYICINMHLSSCCYYMLMMWLFAESVEKLQEHINKLYMYCMDWRLRLNTDKSQILEFGRGSTTVRDDWNYGNSRKKVTNKISYLGLMFSSNVFC